MRIAVIGAALALAACGQGGGLPANASTADNDSAAAPVPAEAAQAPAPAAPGCGDALPVAIDSASFAHSGVAPSPAQVERLRGEAETAFRRVARTLCGEGALPADAFRRFPRLLVQQADGADNAAFWSGEGTPRAGDLVFQAVFHEGGESPALLIPPDVDLREGLICWNDFDGHREMCEARLP